MRRPKRLWFVWDEFDGYRVTFSMPKPILPAWSGPSWEILDYAIICKDVASSRFGLPKNPVDQHLYEFDLIKWHVVAEWELCWE